MSKVYNTVEECLSHIDDARASIAKVPIKIGNQEIDVTVTIGVNELDSAGNESLEQIIARADSALYEGKGSGKNKLVFKSSKGK